MAALTGEKFHRMSMDSMGFTSYVFATAAGTYYSGAALTWSNGGVKKAANNQWFAGYCGETVKIVTANVTAKSRLVKIIRPHWIRIDGLDATVFDQTKGGFLINYINDNDIAVRSGTQAVHGQIHDVPVNGSIVIMPNYDGTY